MIPDGADHFGDMGDLVYLNCASFGPLPRVTQDEIQRALSYQTHPDRIHDGLLFEIPNRARTALARILGVKAEEIFLGSGASHVMSAGALGYPWTADTEVLIAARDFPSNLYIWMHAARRAGATARLAEGRCGTPTTDEILAAVGPRTRIVVASLVDYGNGEVRDLSRLAAFCGERDIFLAVDGTQAVGVMPVATATPGVSLLAVAAYKWMLSPYGTGFGWLDPAWNDRIQPAYISWTAARGAEEFNALPREGWEWVETARRFDGPETASFLNMSALARSAEFLHEVGVDRVHRHVTGLLAGLEAELPRPFRRRAGPSPVAGPILSLEADSTARVHSAYRRLREERLWVSLRDDGIRISPHLYNTPEDLERVRRVLAEAA